MQPAMRMCALLAMWMSVMYVELQSMLPCALLPANWLPYAALVPSVLPFGCFILPLHRLCCSSFGSQMTEHAEVGY